VSNARTDDLESGLVGRLRPRRRPRLSGWSFRPTKSGLIFFGMTFAVGLAALNTGNNLLYLALGMTCALIIVSGVISELTLWGIAVEPVLPGPVHAGQSAMLTLRISNRKRVLPSYCLRVSAVLRAGEAVKAVVPETERLLLRLDPGESCTLAQRLFCRQRGRHELIGFKVTTTFPFHFLRKGWVVRRPAVILCYPALLPLRAEEALAMFAQGGEHLVRHRGQEPESFDSLREMQPGDGLRRVHWKASARRGVLVVKEGRGNVAPAPRIRLVLTAACPRPHTEWAISAATTLLVHAVAAGRGVRFQCNLEEEVMVESDLSFVLARLAVLQPDQDVLQGPLWPQGGATAGQTLLISNNKNYNMLFGFPSKM